MTAPTRSSNGTDSIDKKGMERFGPHYLEAKTCKTKVKKKDFLFVSGCTILFLSEVTYICTYTYMIQHEMLLFNVCTYQLGHHTCAFDNTCACFCDDACIKSARTFEQ